MIIRQLPFEEWDKLAGLPIVAAGYPDPNVSIILVAEEDGHIIGTWMALTPIVLEGLWVDEAHRHSMALGKLFLTMKNLLGDMGMAAAYTLVQTPEVLDLAIHGGFKPISGTFCMLDLEVHP